MPRYRTVLYLGVTKQKLDGAHLIATVKADIALRGDAIKVLLPGLDAEANSGDHSTRFQPT